MHSFYLRMHPHMHRIVVDLRTKQQLWKKIHRAQGSTLNVAQQSQLLAEGVTETIETLQSKILVPHGRPVCISGHDPQVNVMGASPS